MNWTRLRLMSGLANTVEDIDRNIEANLQRSYVPFHEVMGTQSGTVSVVGSGPSLRANWEKLRDLDGDIIACNASCQFLLERGVVPKFMFCFDADPLMLEFMTPHPEITYLLSSRCPPKAFEMVDGCKVVMWHTNGDKNLEKLLLKNGKNEAIIAGGSAAVVRAMMLAQPLGYQEIHLWGCDSSFDGNHTHIRKSTTVEKYLPINCGGREFWTSPWMAQQAEDFKVLSPTLRDRYGVELVVHGDGLLPQIAASMGFKVDTKLAIKQFRRELAFKAVNLWQTI